MMVKLVALEIRLKDLINDTCLLRSKIDESGNSDIYDNYLNHLLVIQSYIAELKRLECYLSDNYVLLSLPIPLGLEIYDNEPSYIDDDLSDCDIQDYIEYD